MFSLIQKIYDHVTTSTDESDQLLAYKRIEITQFACRLGYEVCVDRSISLFEEWMNTTDPDRTNKYKTTNRKILEINIDRILKFQIFFQDPTK